MAANKSVEERLISQSERDPSSGCLRWTGTHDTNGYGRIRINGKNCSTHRTAYTLWVGPIPEGLVLDHVAARGCKWHDCMEPSHLEPVTQKENLRRGKGFAGRNAAAKSCIHGHPFDDKTTYRYLGADGCWRRMCLTCDNDRHRQRYWAKKAKEKEATS